MKSIRMRICFEQTKNRNCYESQNPW